MAYLGLDIGTTGCKASVIDQSGRIQASASREYDLQYPGEGLIEIDPLVVWKSVLDVLSSAASRSKKTIKALSIASFGETFVLLDSNDAPLANSIFYTDIRGSQESADILSAIPAERLFHITGMSINSIYSLNKLLWIKKHRPGLLEKASRLMLYGDYIGYMLTGERVIDYSLASRTMMLDVEKKEWAGEIFGAFALEQELFSRPAQAGTKVGRLRPQLCEKLGLPADVTVVLGGHDQACAALGAGAIEFGDACDGFGAAECISVVIKRSQAKDDMRKNNYCCEPHLIEGKYITLAFNTSAGASLKWYRNTIEAERHRYFSERGENIYGVLDSECEPSPSPVLFLPYMAGSGTPYMDPSAQGAFVGLTLSTVKAQMYKAIIEGICLDMRHNLELLAQTGIMVNRLVAVGGGARSRTLLQIKADVLNKTVTTIDVPEAGTLGLAMLCSVACGDYPDYEAAARAMIRAAAEYSPDPANAALYEKKYAQYKRMYAAVKSIKDTEANR